MRTKFLLAVITSVLFFSDAKAQQKDIIDTLSGYIRTSNSRDFSGYFLSVIELSILKDQAEYSKAQAELILRDFLSRHKPVSVKVVNRLNTNPNYILAVLSLITASDKFRISISLSNAADRFLINEVRIEYDKQ